MDFATVKYSKQSSNYSQTTKYRSSSYNTFILTFRLQSWQSKVQKFSLEGAEVQTTKAFRMQVESTKHKSLNYKQSTEVQATNQTTKFKLDSLQSSWASRRRPLRSYGPCRRTRRPSRRTARRIARREKD